MKSFRKKIYAAAGFTTTFFGPGRSEFDPKKEMRTFDEYLLETAIGTLKQLKNVEIEEGVIASFMPQRFLNQGNLAGFLPSVVPSLLGKPCIAVEGACASGSKGIVAAIKTVLSSQAETVFVTGFEIQNGMKSIYGADVLAGASFYRKERKNGFAYFFPGLFAKRAESYFKKYDSELTKKSFAVWYENAILNARKNPKAQEFENTTKDLFNLAMTPPDAEKFIPFLNTYDCSKISDGASSIIIASEEGLKHLGIPHHQAIEIVSMGEAEGDITKDPTDLTEFNITQLAAKKTLEKASLTVQDMGILEIHDCFSISALLALEAIGFADKGKAADFIIEGNTKKEGLIPTNLSGGLIGFGHPTGATGVRQLVDLWQQLTGIHANQVELKKSFGMMVNMGGNDKTLTSLIVKKND